jgi:peptidoglycan hydrolase FlgJ
MIKSLSTTSQLFQPAATAKPELSAAAQKFEALFLRQLIGSMRQAKLAEDIFGSSASDSFREMADARVADSMASLKQFGIAHLLEKQFERPQETIDD